MKPELERALVRDFPCLFRERVRGGDTSPLAQRGIEVGDGWAMVIRRLAVTIEPLLAKTDAYCSQVKEKWGGLCVYFRNWPLPEEVEQALGEARRAAARTCEECGAPGERRTVRARVWTLCDGCNEREQARVREREMARSRRARLRLVSTASGPAAEGAETNAVIRGGLVSHTAPRAYWQNSWHPDGQLVITQSWRLVAVCGWLSWLQVFSAQFPYSLLLQLLEL